MHVTVRRVVVDVVVSDADGKPVQNLTRGDFRVYENGVLQPIRSFEEYRDDPTAEETKLDLPPGTFSNLEHVPNTGAPTVVLFDLLDTPFEEQVYAHYQLVEFLKKYKLSGQVAVFVLTDKLHMLQGFSDDAEQLLATLNHKSGQTYANGASTMDLSAADAQFDGTVVRERKLITYQAMTDLAHFMGTLPGRKNLIWLTGSVPVDFSPRESVSAVAGGGAMYSGLSDLMNLNHISVYPVDSGGLRVEGAPITGPLSRLQRGGHTESHQMMDEVAQSTGGHAFYNTNGIKESIAEAVSDGSNYYSITFAPAEGGNPAVKNAIESSRRKVRVEYVPGGYHVVYRRDYFTNDVEAMVKRTDAGSNDRFHLAMRHGTPVEHSVFFVAHVKAVSTPAPATEAQTAELAAFARAIKAPETKSKHKGKAPAEAATPMVQGYTVVYSMLLRQLALPTLDDGQHHSDLDLAVVAYNRDGEPLNATFSKCAETLSAEDYTKSMEKGYRMGQAIDVPVGAASLRMAVRDNATGRVGSMEVTLPLSAKVDASSVATSKSTP